MGLGRGHNERATALGAMVAAVLVLLTACASPGPPPASPDEVYGGVFDAVRNTAVANGASEQQLHLIDEYKYADEIPFSVVVEAMNRTSECLDANGLAYTSWVEEAYPGLPVMDYSWGVPAGLTADEARDLGNACGDSESAFIADLYENQASFIDQRDELFRQMRPELVACLRGFGVTVDDDASRELISQLSVELLVTGVVSEPTCVPPQ